jgi:hypothetical protein
MIGGTPSRAGHRHGRAHRDARAHRDWLWPIEIGSVTGQPVKLRVILAASVEV